MTEPTRKLAAILAADVVGYSRLIAEDEARTLDALRALRREPKCSDNGQIDDFWLGSIHQ